MIRELVRKLADVKRKGILFTIKWIFWGYLLKLSALKNRRFVVSKYQIKLIPNYSDATFRLYVFGAYGSFYSDFIGAIDEKFVFVDVGANQGLYSILSCKNQNCTKVFAFEPIKETFSLLEQNIKLNDVTDNVEIFNKAIDSANGLKSIIYDPKHSGSATIAFIPNDNDLIEKIETVNKEFLNRIFDPIREAIHIKIDVEGYEPTVISEILKTSKMGQIVSIFYEVDVRWVNPSDIENTLRIHGFNQFEKIGNSNTHFDVLATR